MPLRIWRFERRVRFLNKFWSLFLDVSSHWHTGIMVLDYCLLDYCMIDTNKSKWRMLSSSLSSSLLSKLHATSQPSRKHCIIATDLSLAVAIILAKREIDEPYIHLHQWQKWRDEVDNMHAELQISRLEWVQQNSKSCSAIGQKIFVCRPIDTRDSEVDTQKTQFWCVEIKNPCVTSSNTANICCVCNTACPAKETFFPCVNFRVDMAACRH